LFARISRKNNGGSGNQSGYSRDNCIAISIGYFYPGIAGIAVDGGKIVEQNKLPEGYPAPAIRTSRYLVFGHWILK